MPKPALSAPARSPTAPSTAAPTATSARPAAAPEGLPWHHLDVTDAAAVARLCAELQPTTLFHLAALLSARGDVLRALGMTVFAMVEYEADDALGAAARIAAADHRVERVLICTPDKDLGQCVGGKVFQFDRRKEQLIGVEEVRDKFGVGPESIPDYLALVGDTADGFPGLPGWGAKSAGAVLARYEHLEHIPRDSHDWDLTVRGASKLAMTLHHQRDEAFLFREIATIAYDAPTVESVDELEWAGPTADLPALAEAIDAPYLVPRCERLLSARNG